MRPRGGRGRAPAASVLVLVLLGLAVPAEAEERPRPPARGWVARSVRVEPAGPGSSVGVAGLGEYRGALELVRGASGVAVVNEVGLEDYLRGISEVPPTWPLEAQRAQAVAARTYALHQMRSAANSATRAAGADICATEACQVYVGLAKERQEHAEAWLSAVESTRGQVLLHRGAPILAKYSSSNGGRSVPGGKPYLRAVNDRDDAQSPEHRWRVTVGYRDLTRALALPGPATSARRSGDAVVVDWAVPGGPAGQATVAVADFRSRLNASLPAPPGVPRPVPSVRFELHPDDAAGVAVLDGRGFGHGIGMSQYGALGKAKRRLRAPEILASYYGGIRPTSLPPDQLPATLRVALDLGRPSVTLAGAGHFRVLDGEGRPLAFAATGAWRVLPGPSRTLRVIPPGEQEGVPTVEPLGLEPEDGLSSPAGPGSALRARLRLSAPALVRVRVERVGGLPPTSGGLVPEGVHVRAVLAAGPPVATRGDGGPPAPAGGEGVPPAAGPPGAPAPAAGQPALAPAPADGAPLVAGPALVGAGEAVLALPALPGPGSYAVSITAEAGEGRVATVPLTVLVPGPARPVARAAGFGPAGAPAPAGVLAAVLLALVVLASAHAEARAERRAATAAPDDG